MKTKKIISTFLWALIACAILALLATSCSHRVYEPLQSVHTDTVYKARRDSVRLHDSTVIKLRTVIRDSTRVKDSTVIKLGADGKQVGYEKYSSTDRYHNTDNSQELQREVDKYKEAYDSLRAVRQDTIRVQKSLSSWQKTKINYGGYAMGIIGLMIICLVLYIAKKKKVFSFLKV